MPYWLGFSLPNATRVFSSRSNGSAAMVSFSMVWRREYEEMGPGSKGFSLSDPKALTILRRRTNRLKAKLIYLIYRALQWAALPFILLYFVYRALKDRRYLRRFPERLGFLPPALRRETAESIWLHAVSVGEVLSTMELLRRLRAELPSAPLFVSTTTLA
ncbi:MAG: hypothetical protein EHM65_08595, partial [Acidobacteriales bacterium]